MKAFWTLAFTVSIAFAQVESKVVATDYAGHPVPDLQPSDLRVIDDGSHQSITSLRRDQSNTAPTVSILLDLSTKTPSRRPLSPFCHQHLDSALALSRTLYRSESVKPLSSTLFIAFFSASHKWVCGPF
jgi:hypothetical protein